MAEAFGSPITYILDWYHLCKKLNELISMIAFGKQQKEPLMQNLLQFCWKGQVGQAIESLQKLDKIRNPAKHKELLDYPTRHQNAIIHYEKKNRLPEIESAVALWKAASTKPLEKGENPEARLGGQQAPKL